LDRATYDKLQKQIEWSYDINEYKKLDAPSYYRIDIAGGEPLMNKTHFEWLHHLAETTDTSRTQLLYNTNGTFVPNDKEIAIQKVRERYFDEFTTKKDIYLFLIT
jgi:hypothetical protein